MENTKQILSSNKVKNFFLVILLLPLVVAGVGVFYNMIVEMGYPLLQWAFYEKMDLTDALVRGFLLPPQQVPELEKIPASYFGLVYFLLVALVFGLFLNTIALLFKKALNLVKK